MVLVAWGPFRWWASCRQAKRKKEEEVQVKQDAEEAARQETICLEEEAEAERKQAEEEEVLWDAEEAARQETIRLEEEEAERKQAEDKQGSSLGTGMAVGWP
jgi:hypothetical protein